MKRIIPLVVFTIVIIFGLLSCRVFNGNPAEEALPLPPLPTLVSAVITNPTEPGVVIAPPPLDPAALQDILVTTYDKIGPGVVSIRGLTRDGGGQGSGFVIDKEGHIITNYHVVEDLNDLEVAFPSGLKVRGEVLGTDLDSDLAVVKVDVAVDELNPLPLGDSDLVKVGQPVIAIGNPFGFEGTMTMGIVSGLSRTIESLHTAPGGGTFSAGDVIQTDAAINPGNSGGPLLNLNGEVIGVNRAIFTTNFNTDGEPVNSGLGFAVSINIVKRVVPELIAHGTYDYPYVGIMSVNDLSLLAVEALGLPRTQGVYVNQVTPGSPADKAGIIGGSLSTSFSDLLSGGDLITAINGTELITFSDFIGYLIKNQKPGDTVVLTILRGDQEMQIPITLEKRPNR
jgi:2-alkenal reductase